MNKINSKGFTLIELLAVITIMGILMMVAIPSISRTIENSRRDTFGDVAKAYVNAVRNAILADEITCNGVAASATETGIYYLKLDTASDENTQNLMESGGKSSWANANVKGYVKWVKTVEDDKYKTVYSVSLRDTGKHGTKDATDSDSELVESEIKRANISGAAGDPVETPADTGAILCVFNG